MTFALHERVRRDVELAGVRRAAIEPIERVEPDAKFDVLAARPGNERDGETLRVELEYDARALRRRHHRAHARPAGRAARGRGDADPDARRADLPLLHRRAERHAAPRRVERTAADYPRAPACTSSSRPRSTGRRTRTRSSTAATRLSYRRAGRPRQPARQPPARPRRGRRVLVGLCVDRSPRCWSRSSRSSRRAGPTCRSIRPTRGRIASPFEDARAPVLAAEPSTRCRHGRTVILVDASWRGERRRGRERREPPREPRLRDLHLRLDRPAEGRRRSSTAAPWRWSRWAHRDVTAPTEFAGVLLATSVCFDLSIFEMFVRAGRGRQGHRWPSTRSSCPCLPARGTRSLLINTRRRLGDGRAAADGSGCPRRCGSVNLAGEPLTAAPGAADLRAARRSSASSTSTVRPRTRPTRPTRGACRGGASAPPIGRPLSDTVGLRARRAPASRCPIGVPGELYIGGDGLARGYLGAPGADRRALRRRPVRRRGAPLPHRRSGALAARRASSSSSVALDHQVKIRGFRIELGEIEAALERPSGRARGRRRRARGRGRAASRLVAYVVAAEAERAGPRAARTSCRAALPEYMVPVGVRACSTRCR